MAGCAAPHAARPPAALRCAALRAARLDKRAGAGALGAAADLRATCGRNRHLVTDRRSQPTNPLGGPCGRAGAGPAGRRRPAVGGGAAGGQRGAAVPGRPHPRRLPRLVSTCQRRSFSSWWVVARSGCRRRPPSQLCTPTRPSVVRRFDSSSRCSSLLAPSPAAHLPARLAMPWNSGPQARRSDCGPGLRRAAQLWRAQPRIRGLGLGGRLRLRGPLPGHRLRGLPRAGAHAGQRRVGRAVARRARRRRQRRRRRRRRRRQQRGVSQPGAACLCGEADCAVVRNNGLNELMKVDSGTAK